MLSNVFMDYGNISIYDSAMRLNYKWKSKEIRYKVSIELDACNLKHLSQSTMTLYMEDTVQVKKDADSGIADIVYAITIARDRDPQTIKYNYKHLCQKLLPNSSKL